VTGGQTFVALTDDAGVDTVHHCEALVGRRSGGAFVAVNVFGVSRQQGMMNETVESRRWESNGFERVSRLGVGGSR
jgi:hypothetical protein